MVARGLERSTRPPRGTRPWVASPGAPRAPCARGRRHTTHGWFVLLTQGRGPAGCASSRLRERDPELAEPCRLVPVAALELDAPFDDMKEAAPTQGEGAPTGRTSV